MATRREGQWTGFLARSASGINTLAEILACQNSRSLRRHKLPILLVSGRFLTLRSLPDAFVEQTAQKCDC